MLIYEDHCPRGRKDCSVLSNIVSDDGHSFVCCGMNDEKTRGHPQDKYRLCFKNEEVDDMSDNDELDLLDLSTVISAGMVHMRRIRETPHPEPTSIERHIEVALGKPGNLVVFYPGMEHDKETLSRMIIEIGERMKVDWAIARTAPGIHFVHDLEEGACVLRAYPWWGENSYSPRNVFIKADLVVSINAPKGSLTPRMRRAVGRGRMHRCMDDRFSMPMKSL